MNDELIFGIDEAGVGPVFGPMIVSGVVIKKKDIEYFKKSGIKDSKMYGSGLTAHNKREKVWESAESCIVRHKQVVIEADKLDRYNMYDLHVEATRSILRELEWHNVAIVYIEQVGGLQRDKYFSRIGFWHNGFVYEKKADVKYIAVSLASIKAKIVRDNIMDKLCKDLDEEYVSGYPNYKTEEFLRRYYKKYNCLPPGTRVSRKWEPIIEMSRNERR
jgi:ribonuclease HII